MKAQFILLTFMILFILDPVNGQTGVPGGDVDTTWTKANSPYRVQGDITIQPGDTLRIEPGVIIDMDGHYRITVKGHLFAEGDEWDSIYFTRVTNDLAMDPDTTGHADTSNVFGSWAGIEFDMDYMDSSFMSHCIIEYVNAVDNNETYSSNLLAPVDVLYDNVLLISHCVIRNNLGTHVTIYSRGGLLKVENCMISDNKVFGSPRIWLTYPTAGIKIEYSDNCQILNSTFMDNKVYGDWASAAISIYEGKALIMNNFITNNRSYKIFTVSAGGILLRNANPVIVNNLIVNNQCDNAGAIYYALSGGKLINNTICNNKSDDPATGAIYFEGATGLIANNNLIHDNIAGTNPSQVYLRNPSSLPIFKNNLIGDGIAEVTGENNNGIKEADNYFGNPQLKNPTSITGIGEYSNIDDWQITTSSSLINLGDKTFIKEYDINVDILGNRRINYGDVDIGCTEYRLNAYTPAASINAPETWVADTIYINADMSIHKKVSVYPGVVICFTGSYKWVVFDSLYVLGNEDAQVLFTCNDTSNFSNDTSPAGGWGYIALGNYEPKVFRHCIFEYGKYFNLDNKIFGVITGDESGNILIENCTFRNCFGKKAAIFRSWSGSNITLRSNTFHNNRNIQGSLIFLSGSNITLVNNFILNNNCQEGGSLTLNGANLRLIGNSIIHNNGKVSLSGSNFEVTNNTIYNNSLDPSFGDVDYLRIKNSIIGPGEVRFSGSEYIINSSYIPLYNCEGICTDMLNDEPVFMNPLSFRGIGPDTEIFAADYSLSAISPGINEGTQDTIGLGLLKVDVAGNHRVNSGRIDIGAYENQEQVPYIVHQPGGGAFCSGDKHIMRVSYTNSDSAIFQWIKDGIIISSATNDSLVFDSLTVADEGNYLCRVGNSYGFVLSNPIFLKITSPPEILVQPQDSWQESGELVNYQLVFSGTSPLEFQWSLHGQDITEANLPEYRFMPSDSSHEGIYRCRISNICGTAVTQPFSMYLAPQLCMVTVSETSGHNLIIWEKKSIAPIMAYNVYRESSAAGIYDKLVTIPYDDLSIFVDTVADPTVQAYLYKITAIDTAGNETDADLCKQHKTIHLLVSTNPELNTTQLEWDRYYGFEYQTYLILRSINGTVFNPVDSMSSNLNSWTDPDPVEGELVYRIAVERPDPCYPEGSYKKAGTGPYNHSLSNLDDNRLQAGQLPPDTITLSNNSIEEENLPATVIGKLITEDQDSIDAHTYQFVPGVGDDDNISFTLLGDLLLASESFDYETKDRYSIRIRSTDQAGNYCEVPFIIQIIDVDETTGLPVLGTGKVKVYPNPFSDYTTITFPNPSGRSYRMVLTDLSGKVCRIVEDITTSEYMLEKGNLMEGFYFIELTGPKIHRGKIVIE